MQGRGGGTEFPFFSPCTPVSYFEADSMVPWPAYADSCHSETYRVPPSRYANDLRIKSRDRRSWD